MCFDKIRTDHKLQKNKLFYLRKITKSMVVATTHEHSIIVIVFPNLVSIEIRPSNLQ